MPPAGQSDRHARDCFATDRRHKTHHFLFNYLHGLECCAGGRNRGQRRHIWQVWRCRVPFSLVHADHSCKTHPLSLSLSLSLSLDARPFPFFNVAHWKAGNGMGMRPCILSFSHVLTHLPISSLRVWWLCRFFLTKQAQKQTNTTTTTITKTNSTYQ